MNKYYFIVRDLYEDTYIAGKMTFKEQLGKNANKMIITLVLYLVVGLPSIIIINNTYYTIFLLLILGFIYRFFKKMLRKTRWIDQADLYNNYQTNIKAFSDVIEIYGFDSKFIESIIKSIQQDIRKKEKKNEIRSVYSLQFSLVLFGIIAFFSKEFWNILDVSSFIKKDIITSSTLIGMIVFFLFYGLLIYRIISNPNSMRYSQEEKVLIALEEVLMYRKKEGIIK